MSSISMALCVSGEEVASSVGHFVVSYCELGYEHLEDQAAHEDSSPSRPPGPERRPFSEQDSQG